MNNIKSYAKYKASGIAWLGDIPEHWEVRKAKKMFRERSEKGFENEPFLAATQEKGVVLKSMLKSKTVLVTKDFHTLKLVEEGDFVISLRSFQGGIEYAHYRGIISPAYTILNPSKMVERGFFRYYFKSKEFINCLTLLVTGIREGQNVDTGKFKDTFLPLPPLSEQTDIANFLDYKTAKIDRFIAKKKQLIKLLNEQKLAIINDAVTKGLNPNIKMKPSSIEWLGDIPEHWEVRKLKYVTNFQSGEMITSQTISPEGEFPVYGGGGFRGYTNSYTNDGSHILIGRQGALCGNIKYAKGKFWASEHSIVTYPKIEIESIYLGEVLTICNLGKLSQTAAQPGIAIGQIKNVYIPIPPVQEQTTIVSYIEKETAKLNQTIATIEKEITLVQEYRTALIAEAVTGKIDVRDYEIAETPIVDLYEELEDEMSLAAEEEVGYGIE